MMVEEARKLRRHLIILLSVIIVLLLLAGVVASIRLSNLQKDFDARCKDSKDARAWVTDALDIYNDVITTRRADDEEFVARVEALELRKPTDFEPIDCP